MNWSQSLQNCLAFRVSQDSATPFHFCLAQTYLLCLQLCYLLGVAFGRQRLLPKCNATHSSAFPPWCICWELTFSSSSPLCFQEQKPRQATVPPSPTVRLGFYLGEGQCHRAYMEARGRLLSQLFPSTLTWIQESHRPPGLNSQHLYQLSLSLAQFTSFFFLTSSDFDELRLLSMWGVFIHP